MVSARSSYHISGDCADPVRAGLRIHSGRNGRRRKARTTQKTRPLRAPEAKFAEKHKERARDLLAKVGTLLPVAAGARATRAQIMMLRAGYRVAEATLAIQGMRILTPIALSSWCWSRALYRSNPFFILLFRHDPGLHASGDVAALENQDNGNSVAPGPSRRTRSARDLRGSRAGTGSIAASRGAGACASFILN